MGLCDFFSREGDPHPHPLVLEGWFKVFTRLEMAEILMDLKEFSALLLFFRKRNRNRLVETDRGKQVKTGFNQPVMLEIVRDFVVTHIFHNVRKDVVWFP